MEINIKEQRVVERPLLGVIILGVIIITSSLVLFFHHLSGWLFDYSLPRLTKQIANYFTLVPPPNLTNKFITPRMPFPQFSLIFPVFKAFSNISSLCELW